MSKRNPPSRPVSSVAPPRAVKPEIEVHESRSGFFHRICCGEAVGQWSTYQGIAVLKIGDEVYRACTDYYAGSLPTNVVFTIYECR